MAEQTPQTYETHRRFVPVYHYFASLLFVINLLWTAWQVFKAPSAGTVVALLLAVGLLVLFLVARTFALTVQDRVIRLEERLRFERILPDDLKARIGEITRSQFVGLRFASDGEVAGLLKTALDEKLGGEEIKKRIKTWRPDTLRV